MRQRLAALILTVAALSACGDDDKSTPARDGGGSPIDAAPPPLDSDASAHDGGISHEGDGATPVVPSDCFLDPSTYLEILNACTDSEKVTKNPNLPLLMVDGGLPPLP